MQNFILIALCYVICACEPTYDYRSTEETADALPVEAENAGNEPGETPAVEESEEEPEEETVEAPLPPFENIAQLVGEAQVEQLATGFQFVEGPVWIPDGYLLFSDIPANRIVKWQAGEGVSDFRNPSENSNGLTFDENLGLVACEHGGRGVTVAALDQAKTSFASTYNGQPFNSPNDCIVDDGAQVWFTDPPYGLGNTPSALGFNGLFRSDGTTVTRLAADVEFNRPNGLAFNRDRSALYVADTADNVVHKFMINADLSLGGRIDFAEVQNPDGIKVDVRDHLYVTGADGVRVYQPNGNLLGTISFPEQPANLSFGGANFDELFVTARTSLYRIRLNVKGKR